MGPNHVLELLILRHVPLLQNSLMVQDLLVSLGYLLVDLLVVYEVLLDLGDLLG